MNTRSRAAEQRKLAPPHAEHGAPSDGCRRRSYQLGTLGAGGLTHQEPARGEGQGVLPVLCAVLSRSSLISAEPRSAKIFKFAPLPLCPPIGQRKRLA